MNDAANFSPELAERVAHARSLDLSYALPYQSIAQLWAERRTSDSPLLTFVESDGTTQHWRYEELGTRVAAVAAVLLQDYGLAPGDRIANLLGNSPETVILYLAAWTSGLTVVPINIGEDDTRITYILEHARVRIAFAPPEQATRVTTCPVVTALPEVVREDVGATVAIGPDTEALIVYTSGTTGPPKGVVLEHRNLLADAQGIARWHRLTAADRAMLILPLHHVNGIIVTLLTPLLTGGSIVLNRKFSASRFWQTIAAERCTWSSVVPTILAFLCEVGTQPVPPHFRHLICGAGPLTTDLARRFDTTFGVRVVHGYGLSETTCYSCFLPIDLDTAHYAHWMWDCGFPSIGVPLPENAMAIHDESGNPLPAEQRGEIVVRGVTVMRAYYQRPDANASAFAHGWFRSGDEGFWRTGSDGRSYFFITGRLKELIIRGGINYAPLEIDEVLCRIPGVKAAMAVGFENDFYGEEIGAYVQCEPGVALTADAILAFCQRELPFAKAPKVVVFGDDFPVTSTGKYQRSKLKERFAPWKAAEFRQPKRG